jgi:hypothetical protein
MTSLGVGANLQEAAGIVAIRSGSKATCTVTIPYSWPLTSASHDKVTLGTTSVPTRERHCFA